MSPIIIINIVNGILLLLLSVLYVILSFPIWLSIALVLFVIYIFIINHYLLKKTDLKIQLIQADKNHRFKNEVIDLLRALESVEFYKDIFEKYEPIDPVRKTYDTLKNKAELNVQRAIKWINHYNPISCPSAEYIWKLSSNSQQIVTKLDELDEVVIKLEDSTSDVDLSYVDNILTSLKEILEDE